MSNTTQWLTMKVDAFFRETDNEMERIYAEKNPQRLLNFIADYVEQFPTPARYIYEKIFEKHKDLHEHYTDYTLTALKPEAEATKWVEKCRKDHAQKEAEYPQKLETYRIQKEAYEKDPANYPNKPKMPDKIWPFYIEFYNNRIIAKALKEKGITLRTDWKGVIAEQGYLFMQGAWKGNEIGETDGAEKGEPFVPDTRKANAVRSLMFDLAFALDWDEEVLRNMLRKLLLQADFNPKDPTEAVYWYCLANKISYSRMRSEYLDYIESDDFKEAYALGVPRNSGINRDTVSFETKLKGIIRKEKEELFCYLWVLKYTNICMTRKTPAEIYWENFRCFPKEVWTGTGGDAQETVTDADLRQLELLEPGESVEAGTDLASLEAIIDAIVRLNPEKPRKGSDDGNIDYLFAPSKQNQEDGEAQKVFLYSEEEYQKILSLILEKSRKNYYADNKEQLMSPDKLKTVFGNLDYVESKVKNRKSGKAALSRTDVIATKFISFFSDLFELYPDLDKKKRDRWSIFRELVNDDLEACGLYKFYPRSPFELFIILCFWQQDPFAYFMASWEASKRA